MTQQIQKADSGALAAAVVIKGDLSGLNDQQLATYYIKLCESLELNHLTRPFSLLVLNGKKVFYANRDCTDQLRHKRGVSVTITGREHIDDLIVVTARAVLPDGRTDESIGALPLGKLQGEARANALMKAETKAKRRVTLSICGLGMMDETEVEGAIAEVGGERHSPHVTPGEDSSAAPMHNPKYDAIMKALLAIDEKIARQETITYDEVLEMREQIGRRGQPTEIGKQMSDLVLGDKLAPSQRAELGRLWNRLDRQVTKLEGTVQPPPVEQSFEDMLEPA